MIEQYNSSTSYDQREKMPIFNPIGGAYGVFPVTDKCEHSAVVLGEDIVKLVFDAEYRMSFDAFSFIIYENKHFFLKEAYRPVPKGNYYEYAMTFVSPANMLSKHVFMRYYQVPDMSDDSESESEVSFRDIMPEPEINVNANLGDMIAIVLRSIVGASSRVPKFAPIGGSAQTTVYAQMLSAITLEQRDMIEGSELKTFSFESSSIEEALTQITGEYNTEWWITENNESLKLHVCKCEEYVVGDDQSLVPATPAVVSDVFKYVDGKPIPYSSQGLLSCSYSQEWGNIPQRILPFGSERNIVRKQALDKLNDKDVFVSYGKRLRLSPTHQVMWQGQTKNGYIVKDKEGNDVLLEVGSYGEVNNPSVTTGIEKTELFEDIYPQGHYIVTKCEKSRNGVYYTIEAQAVKQDAEGKPMKDNDGQYILYSVQEMSTPIGQTVIVDGETKNGLGLVPIMNKEQTEDLTIRFESGFLNGREFGVSRNNGVSIKINDVDYRKLSLDIVPDGNDDTALSLPNDTWFPQEKSSTYEGDMFAIFNMDMPDAYVTMAEQRLAQATYDKLIAYQASRPDVKCKTEPRYFDNLSMLLGKRFSVYSELFGDLSFLPDGSIDEQNSVVFTSRVTAYSYSLTQPKSIEFTLASGRVEGHLAEIEGMISDTSTELRGLEQRHINLSKRGWHDAEELSRLLDSLVAEMMLVGNAKYQFSFTFAITLGDGNDAVTISNVKHTSYINIAGGGCIQHTQKPYIDYPGQGLWYVEESTINLYSGTTAVYDPTKAYYVYAEVNNTGARITSDKITLSETKKDGEMFMLLGVLSSEFEDIINGDNTSYRVFNRTNGYTAMTGGTLTTEQIQDANRQLIIDFQHNPPRIIAKRGAQIIGNITFMSLLDENGNNAGEEIFKTIGGENLYTKADPLTVPTIAVYTGIMLENGKKYVITIGEAEGDGIHLVALEKNGSDIGYLLKDKAAGTTHIDKDIKLVVTGSGKELGFVTRSSGAHSFSLSEILIQEGEKPTRYQSSYKYLAEAFEHDATKQTTEINGGLLATSLIKLRNQNSQVTAGMSGLNDIGKKAQEGSLVTDNDSEGVTLWGGGDYSDALAAAAGNGDIPVLLTKTGLKSRIGCFRVVDKDTIAVITDQSTIYVTNKTISSKVIVEDTKSANIFSKTVTKYEDYSVDGDYMVWSASILGGKYQISVPSLTMMVMGEASANNSNGQWARAQLYINLRLEIRNNGTVKYSSSYKNKSEEWVAHTPGERDLHTTSDIVFPSYSGNLELAAGTLEIAISGEITADVGAGSLSTAYFKMMTGSIYVSAVNLSKYVVMAKDGIGIVANSNSTFYVKTDSASNLQLIAKGLPTSPTGLSSGQLWRNSDNQLCIIP